MQDNQALIVVDVQKDFLETGALPVKEGSQVVPVINRITRNLRMLYLLRTGTRKDIFLLPLLIPARRFTA